MRIVAATVLGMLLMVGGVLAWLLRPVSYSTGDPDYYWLESAFADVDPIDADPRIDLSRLNDGDWTNACILGGYTKPADAMSEHGQVTDQQRIWLDSLVRGTRIAPVEEHELVIAYALGDGSVGFVHLPRSPHPGYQHFERCTDRSDPTGVPLPLHPAAT